MRSRRKGCWQNGKRRGSNRWTSTRRATTRKSFLWTTTTRARAWPSAARTRWLTGRTPAGGYIPTHAASPRIKRSSRTRAKRQFSHLSGFDGTRVTAAGAALAKEDLDAYDLIVCVDAAVRDAVLALGGDESYETSVRLLEDFATVADARSRALFDGLDDVALAARARSRQDGGELVVEGSDAQSDRDGFDALLESTLVLTAALVVFLKDSFDASFVDSFNGLLRTHFYDERHVDARWADAESALRRHIVTGALDPRERERLFDAHMTGLRQRLGGDM